MKVWKDPINEVLLFLTAQEKQAHNEKQGKFSTVLTSNKRCVIKFIMDVKHHQVRTQTQLEFSIA